MPEKLLIPPHTRRSKPPLQSRPYERSFRVANTLLASFKYAGSGLLYAFNTQRNFRIHAAIGTLALTLGVFLELNTAKLSIIVLTSALVMAMELVNTALESVVDLTVGNKYYELARIAKDCAAGAVLMLALAALTIAGFLLLPPLTALL